MSFFSHLFVALLFTFFGHWLLSPFELSLVSWRSLPDRDEAEWHFLHLAAAPPLPTPSGLLFSSETDVETAVKRTTEAKGSNNAEANTNADLVVLPRRRNFPSLEEPRICVCVLSCGRLHLLERTLAGVIEHLEQDEPQLSYEIVWVSFVLFVLFVLTYCLAFLENL